MHLTLPARAQLLSALDVLTGRDAVTLLVKALVNVHAEAGCKAGYSIEQDLSLILQYAELEQE